MSNYRKHFALWVFCEIQREVAGGGKRGEGWSRFTIRAGLPRNVAARKKTRKGCALQRPACGINARKVQDRKEERAPNGWKAHGQEVPSRCGQRRAYTDNTGKVWPIWNCTILLLKNW